MAANLTFENPATTHSGGSMAGRLPLAEVVSSVREAVESWSRRAEARRQLAQLSERALRDIGFDPESARREAAKPFWKPYTLTPSTDL
jgi:uncharacterized protein YjiS (DUF1127 family)